MFNMQIVYSLFSTQKMLAYLIGYIYDYFVCQVYHQARRPARHKADRLTERINALTIPREQDAVPPGLIESLPPEGKKSNLLLVGYFSMPCLCVLATFITFRLLGESIRETRHSPLMQTASLHNI